MPRELTINQKQQCIDDSELCLKLFNRNKPKFLCRSVTTYERWYHHFTLESKQQLAEWTARAKPTRKRGIMQRPAGKVMGSIFWDARGIKFIGYLEKRKNINNDY